MKLLFTMVRPVLPWLIGAALLTVGLAWFGSHERSVGAAKVQKLWDADKAERIKRTTDITNLWNTTRQQREDAADELKRARETKTSAVREAVNRLPGVVAGVRIPAAAVRVLNAASDSANAAGASGASEETAATAAEDTSLGLLAGWYTEVAAIHAQCRDDRAEWLKFYEGLRGAQ